MTLQGARKTGHFSKTAARPPASATPTNGHIGDGNGVQANAPGQRIGINSSASLSPTQSAAIDRKRATDGAQEKPAASAPRKAGEGDVANALLNLEREARQAETEAELGYLIVNGSRVAVQYRQALLLLRSGPAKHRVVAVSSLSAIDRNSTFIRWIERLAGEKLAGENATKIVSFDARAKLAGSDLDASSYPFSKMAFLPLQLRDGTVFAYLLLTREADWDERSLVAGARLCETFSHAWEFISGPKRAKRKLKSKSLLLALGAAGIVLAGFLPVPLSALAPAEVTPANPFVVAAPIDGVVETIAVDPNTMVKKGDVLFRYNDTDLRNRLKLAGQAVSVAEARYQQSVRTSFADAKAKRELSIAQSELQLKAGEYDYARELMDKAVVTAGSSGLIIFADKDTWTGRPVSTGERIMRIADPAKVEMTLSLPVADAIVLEKDAPVQLYLDSDPLKAISGKLVSASFHAQPDGAGTLSYNVRATFDANDQDIPRIGLRGTAKVYGEDVSLAYFLFRKPLSVVRQWIGY